MAELKRLEGILVALITPLDEQERVDEAALRALLRRVLGAGAHGVVVLGTAGESVALTDEEKGRAIAVAVDEVAGRVPVIAGTGEPSTKRAIITSQMAARRGADAAIVVPPYYYMLSQPAVREHYQRLAAEAGLPILLYNIPFHTKITIEVETACELAQNPRIVGIKDSGGNFAYFQRLVQRAKSDKFCVVTGSDGLLFASLMVGGDGCISPGANAVPAWFVQLWNAVKDGRTQDAWAVQQKIMSFGASFGYGTFPAGLKATLSLLGIGSGVISAPLTGVTPQQRHEIEAKLKEFGLL